MMRTRHEIEVKLPVPRRRVMKRLLAELGFRPVVPRHFESNHLYDFAGRPLRKAGCLLRLRFAGSRSVLTFKGAPLRSRSYKIRREVETEVEEGKYLQEIFKRLRLREVFRYDKYRTVYAGSSGSNYSSRKELVYDETPIGDFIELEGPRRWIDMTARQLGYTPKDYITASYSTLYRRHCQAQGLRPGDMVFSPLRRGKGRKKRKR
jgi:adenylate cyclase class 2